MKNPTSSIPTLLGPNGLEAIGIKEKANLLRTTAFSKAKEANLEDIRDFHYPPPIESDLDLLNDEILGVGLKTLKDSAPGPDGIPNRVIHLVLRERIHLLQPLLEKCLSLGYHPQAFHTAQTVFLQKPKKEDYTSLNAYRPIALLNTLGKLLESIVATRLRSISEENSLLPNSQYGARPNRSTTSALFILQERLRLAKSYSLVPSLLALDVQKAFDNVSHERLVHNLRAKRVPTAITKWVSSFLANRSTTVQLGDYISEEKEIEVGIPQGSPISPILYLFYNAPLLESLEGLYLSLSPTGFVDDIALLTYSRSVKRNIYTLQKAYQECLKWATSHGSKFNAEKSELIHFTRRKDSRLGITLEGKTIPPSKEVRLLGVYFNQSLSPSSHLEKIEEKILGLLGTLGSLSRSTWGLRLELARKLYLGAFRPAIAYGGISWYPIANTRGKKGVIDTLQKWQGKFLR